MQNLDELKALYRIEDAWRDEGLEGSPSKCGRSPFRADQKPSFSVFADGTQWKDHATDERGDVFTFLQIARKCSFQEALIIVRKRLNLSPSERYRIRHSNKRAQKQISISKADTDKPMPMPQAVEAIWTEGLEFLSKSPKSCKRIDEWRGWPSETTSKLCEFGLIACPIVNGTPGIAFPVFAQGTSGTIQTGFHLRTKGSGGWQFLPTMKQHKQRTRPLPFVLGNGHLTSARLLIITEGQWDCVSWAAWAGWLQDDCAWPKDVSIMGIRGANNWRLALECFKWPQSVEVLLIPDNDLAGDTWKTGFLNGLKKRSQKITVFQPEANDLSDMLNASEDPEALIHDILSRIDAY